MTSEKKYTKLPGMALVVCGLLAMSAYQIMLHVPHPAMFDNDLVHGLWLGVSFGLELLGLYLLAKQNRVPVSRRQADPEPGQRHRNRQQR